VVRLPAVTWGLEGKIGVVVHYFTPLDDGWFPTEALVVVLIESHLVFFYEEEVEIINHED